MPSLGTLKRRRLAVGMPPLDGGSTWRIRPSKNFSLFPTEAGRLIQLRLHNAHTEIIRGSELAGRLVSGSSALARSSYKSHFLEH